MPSLINREEKKEEQIASSTSVERKPYAELSALRNFVAHILIFKMSPSRPAAIDVDRIKALTQNLNIYRPINYFDRIVSCLSDFLNKLMDSGNLFFIKSLH